MKSLFLVFIFIAVAAADTMAQSMLKVHLADNSRINLAVDGRFFNKTGTSVTVGELPPGRHKLTIYTLQQNRYGNAHQEVIYSGKIFTHYGNITLFTYDANTNETYIQEQDVHDYSQNNPPANYGVGTYENNMPPQVNNNNNDYDNDNKYIQPDAPAASPVSPDEIPTLTDNKISTLKKKADDKKADLQKLSVLKDGLNGEKMTTDHVSTMMDLFNFEDSKVTFAKWAYPNTVDKENFSSLESKLSYKNYEDDLDAFIKNNGR